MVIPLYQNKWHNITGDIFITFFWWYDLLCAVFAIHYKHMVSLNKALTVFELLSYMFWSCTQTIMMQYVWQLHDLKSIVGEADDENHWNYHKLYLENGLNDFCFRLTTLLQEISCEQEAKTIIFVETKRKVEDIARNVRRCGWVWTWCCVCCECCFLIIYCVAVSL